jgi:hypothetical protein
MCQSGTTVATCATDANSCLFVSTTQPCAPPQVCTGSAPSAMCGLTCTNTCTQGQKSCVNGGLATCAVGANGCFSFGAPVGCPAHESCAGPSGGASCQCVGDSICTGTIGPTCSGSTLVTCAKDATTGCNIQMSTQTCTNGACTGAAGKAMCCTNACAPVNGKQCAAGGVVQTCQVDPTTGCTKWVNTSTCGTNQVCTGAGQCSCSAATTSCSGACVDVNGIDVANCGACGIQCHTGFVCSGGQCVCNPFTPNGFSCMRSDGLPGVCWAGACLLPPYVQGCTAAADCVPGGCSADGFCRGTADAPAEVSCTRITNGGFPAFVTCVLPTGCSTSGQNAICVAAGAGNQCDGPSDCPANNDCCVGPSTAPSSCQPRPQPDVVGSGCAALDTNPFGPQAGVVCDPVNPVCPSNQSCVGSSGFGFICN